MQTQESLERNNLKFKELEDVKYITVSYNYNGPEKMDEENKALRLQIEKLEEDYDQLQCQILWQDDEWNREIEKLQKEVKDLEEKVEEKEVIICNAYHDIDLYKDSEHDLRKEKESLKQQIRDLEKKYKEFVTGHIEFVRRNRS
jgi:phage shock protein A